MYYLNLKRVLRSDIPGNRVSHKDIFDILCIFRKTKGEVNAAQKYFCKLSLQKQPYEP